MAKQARLALLVSLLLLVVSSNTQPAQAQAMDNDIIIVNQVVGPDPIGNNTFEVTWNWIYNTAITGFAIAFASSDITDSDGTLPPATICEIDYASPEAEAIFNPQGLISAKALFDQMQVDNGIGVAYGGATMLGTNNGAVEIVNATFSLMIDCDAFLDPPDNLFCAVAESLSVFKFTVKSGTGFLHVVGPGLLGDQTFTTPIPILLAQDKDSNIVIEPGPEPGLGDESPPPPMNFAEVRSDPHFKGLRGQQYDVMGEAGAKYCLVSDHDILINACFAAAYATGLFVDSETMAVYNMRLQGTWISQLALTLRTASDGQAPVVTRLEILREHADSSDEEMLKFGKVVVDGSEMNTLVTDMPILPELLLSTKNKKQYSRVVVEHPLLALEVDVIPPPAEWKIQELGEDPAAYSHLNLNLNKITLSPNAHGLIGSTQTLNFNEQGRPIMQALTEDGAGVIEGTLADYRVSSLFADDFKYCVANDDLVSTF
mmetsp:Transcript_3156/g.11395  ORF Transcript_3156/g.11395 Transcript_3156/m.11395 type:complete len:486 (-) Transcript_3156:155-1612(-)